MVQGRSYSMLALWLFVVAGLAPCVVTAQSDAASGEGAAYFTSKVLADPGASGVKHFDTVATAPASATDQKAYLMTSLFAATYQTQFDITAKEPFTLGGKLKLDVWLSCDVAAAFRPAYQNTANDLQAVRFALFKGATQFSEAHHYNSLPTCTGASTITEIKLEADSLGTSFAKGEVLGLQVVLWTTQPPEAQAKNVHFLVGSSKHPSSVKGAGLPGSAPAAPAQNVIQGNLTGATATVALSLTNASSDTYRYNWTSQASNLTIAASAGLSNGSAAVIVRNAAGNESLNHTFTASDGPNSTAGANITGASSGTWVIEVVLSAAVGRIDLSIQETKATPTSTNQTSSVPGPSSNETASAAAANSTKKAGIPGFEAALLLGAVGTLVAVARRRED